MSSHVSWDRAGPLPPKQACPLLGSVLAGLQGYLVLCAWVRWKTTASSSKAPPGWLLLSLLLAETVGTVPQSLSSPSV